MKRRWDLKPNLLDCVLEERVAPAIANLGVIVLTTSGYALVTPFPGASNSTTGSLGSNGPSGGTAASVSGVAVPSSFYITGNRGMSSFAPGNFTGNPTVGAAIGGAAALSVTIQVGSGSDQAGAAPATTVNRIPIGDNGNRAAVLAHIGQPATGSGGPVLPPGESYRNPTAPVPSLPPLGVVLPASPAGPTNGAMVPANPLNPQAGAPSHLPATGPRMTSPLPGGLGVPNGLLPPGPN
jgi:hypothetical protein